DSSARCRYERSLRAPPLAVRLREPVPDRPVRVDDGYPDDLLSHASRGRPDRARNRSAPGDRTGPGLRRALAGLLGPVRRHLHARRNWMDGVARGALADRRPTDV